MYEKDGDSRKRANFYLSLRFRSIHLSSFDLSVEDPDNPSLSAIPDHFFLLQSLTNNPNRLVSGILKK